MNFKIGLNLLFIRTKFKLSFEEKKLLATEVAALQDNESNINDAIEKKTEQIYIQNIKFAEKYLNLIN